MEANVLRKVNNPGDLKLLSEFELAQLAEEIRNLIIDTTSKTGGHLASSLGAVEISIALLRTFDPPRDKIIWDVGHQTYAYKILTGRKDRFHTLRKPGGLSGFPKRSESEYDVVDSGHAGPSLGYAFGLALSRDSKGENYKIAAVIGDGSMTSGVAYEALNQIGHYLKSNLTIILNDNGMSISANVGGFSSYLSRIRIKRTYTQIKEQLEEFARTCPAFGDAMVKLATNLKKAITHAILPGMLFESLGIKYVGPIDGHDIALMEKTFIEASQVNQPVLIHLVTKKGKGYEHSEQRPEKFHGVPSFDKKNGELPGLTSGQETYTSVFGSAIVDAARKDKRIFAITAAMRLGTGLEAFSRIFPERFIDVGIAEQLAVTLGAGLALGGLKPVVAIYSTFLQRAFDQLSQEVCLQGLPVVFIVDRAGIVGEDGETHHGYFDLSYLRALPNMTVMAPSCAKELEEMLDFALSLEKPAAIRFPRGKVPKLDGMGEEPLGMGRGEIISQGKDLAIFSIGDMLPRAVEVVKELKQEGITTTLVNARFAKPLNNSFVGDVAKDKKLVVTVENNIINGGFGSAILEVLANLGITVPVLTFGLPDRYIEHGTIEGLLDSVGLKPETILSRILGYLKVIDEKKA